jgi:hypothetical protein
MATAAKFVQPIPIFLAYLVPLDVDVVPIKCHPEMPLSNFMKPCRNIICHVKLVFLEFIFSKWLPLPWKRPKC